MEYIFAFSAGILFFAFIVGREIYASGQKKKAFLASLYQNYGKLPQKEYSLDRFAKIDSYYKRHPKEGQIDDITWNDLNMDDVFMMLNTTFSASGEEYLYYRLRTPYRKPEEMTYSEEMTEFFEHHPDERVKIQYLMSRLGHTGKYSLYDYLENLETLGDRSNIKHFLTDALYLAGIVIAFFHLSAGLLFLAVLMIYHILSYFKEKNENDAYMVSFAYLSRLVSCAQEILDMKTECLKEENTVFEEGCRRLAKISRNSWLVFSGGAFGTSSNPLDLLLDYLKMIFHIDIIMFNNMLHTVKVNQKVIDRMIEAVGRVECAISVGSFRKHFEGKWCRPDFGMAGKLKIKNIYHPVLTDPVGNDLEVAENKGILITGSNASGKSTFLRTVSLNLLLAQTIYTCTAEYFGMYACRLFSSMSLKDSLLKGESYYMTEIRSIKRILDACGGEGNPVICFVDEVLRGTNTVERIAASTEILQSLSGENVLCFAATHDVELTSLLEESYDNYHFEEQIVNEDVSFSYKIMKGKAQSSNAIKLLKIMGYEESIIERANMRAERFLHNGVWR